MYDGVGEQHILHDGWWPESITGGYVRQTDG